MVEVGQRLPLTPKSLQNIFGSEPRPDELDSDGFLVLVVRTSAFVDRPHAARCNSTNDFVSADVTSDPGLTSLGKAGRDLECRRFKNGRRIVAGRQQRFDFRPKRRIVLTLLREAIATLLQFKLADGFEKRDHLLPTILGQLPSPFMISR